MVGSAMSYARVPVCHAPIAKRSTRVYRASRLSRATTLRDGWPTIEPSAEPLRRFPTLHSRAPSLSPLWWGKRIPTRGHGDSTESNRIKPKPAEQTYSCTNFERERDGTREACTNRLLPLPSLASPLLLFTRISSMHLSLNSSFTSNPTFERIANRSLNWWKSRGNSITRSREIVNVFDLDAVISMPCCSKRKPSREHSRPKRSRHDWFLSIIIRN